MLSHVEVARFLGIAKSQFIAVVCQHVPHAVGEGCLVNERWGLVLCFFSPLLLLCPVTEVLAPSSYQLLIGEAGGGVCAGWAERRWKMGGR